MVTEKNKEQFEKYLYDYYVLQYGKTEDLLSYAEMIDWVSAFNVLPFEMKIGVYLAYYDSLRINIDVVLIFISSTYSLEIENTQGVLGVISYDAHKFKTRKEAYIEAFKKIDELINQNKDN